MVVLYGQGLSLAFASTGTSTGSKEVNMRNNIKRFAVAVLAACGLAVSAALAEPSYQATLTVQGYVGESLFWVKLPQPSPGGVWFPSADKSAQSRALGGLVLKGSGKIDDLCVVEEDPFLGIGERALILLR